MTILEIVDLDLDDHDDNDELYRNARCGSQPGYPHPNGYPSPWYYPPYNDPYHYQQQLYPQHGFAPQPSQGRWVRDGNTYRYVKG